jgi:hypothetical protein
MSSQNDSDDFGGSTLLNLANQKPGKGESKRDKYIKQNEIYKKREAKINGSKGKGKVEYD